MVRVGLIAELEAKPGKEEDLAALLRSAPIRTGTSSFAIVDAVPNDAGRHAPRRRPGRRGCDRADLRTAGRAARDRPGRRAGSQARVVANGP